MNDTLTGSVYVHAKTGKFYEIICPARLEADESVAIVYRACRIGQEPVEQYGPVWVRPLAEFMDGRFVEASQWQSLGLKVAALVARVEQEPT